MQRQVLWLLKVFFAFNCALIAWEIILSQTYIKKPLTRTHPVLGRIEGQGTYIQGKEGYSRTVLNELGMRSAPLTPKKPAEKRILVLGDSYTMAMQVEDKQTFTQRLGSNLSGVVNIATINAGGEGSAPSDYIALAQFNRKTYQPDVTVIQLNEGDFVTDPFETNRKFFFEKTLRGYKVQNNRNFVSKNATASRFAKLQKYLNFSVMRVALEHLESAKESSPENNSTVEKQDHLPTLVPFVVQKLKQSYNRPIIVFIPKIDYFSSDITKPSQAEMLLEKAAKQQQITLISMRKDYVKLYREARQTAHGFSNTKPGFGHINALGHELVAERLTKAIDLGTKQGRKP
jgi:hypothetical protein